MWSPCIWNTLFKEGDHHPDLPVQMHCPRCSRDVAEAWQPRQPYNTQSLEELQADLIRPWHRGAFRPPWQPQPQKWEAPPQLCFFIRRRVGGIEEVLEVFPSPTHNVPS